MNCAIASTHFHHFWVLSELLILVTFALAKENKGKKVYKMKRIVSALFCASCLLTAHAQSRLSVGGYGEAVFSRNFYSDHVSRYSQPEEHKDDPSHGRFDIPHAVIYLGYDFGKGWTLGTEIEFEHGGTGIAYEKEDEEGGWRDLRIFPHGDRWYAATDMLPSSLDHEHQRYIQEVFPRMMKEIEAEHWDVVDQYIDRLLQYQRQFGNTQQASSITAPLPVMLLLPLLFLLFLLSPLLQKAFGKKSC